MDDVKHTPLFRLDQIAAGLVEDPHVDTCAQCATRLAEIQSERRAFLALHPPAAEASRLLEKRPAPRTVWSWAMPLISFATAACLLFVIVRDSRPKVLRKGGPTVAHVVQLPGSSTVRSAKSGEALPAGTAVQIEVDPGDHRHVSVFAVGQDGAPVHLLTQQIEDRTRLGQSFVLDDALEPELIVVLLSMKPLSRSRAEKEISATFSKEVHDAASIKVEGAVVKSILINKQGGP